MQRDGIRQEKTDRERLHMIRKEIPQAEYAHIGGSGTWGDDFPENVGIEGVKILDADMEFETPFGTTVPMMAQTAWNKIRCRMLR